MKNLGENDTPVIPGLTRDPRRVLILALSGIGNLIMQLPTIEALKKARPDWQISVWVAPRGTRAIAESQPYIDDVIEMPIRSTIVGHIKNVAMLRSQQFDIGIVLSPGQLVKSAAYLKLAGVPIRIGNTYPYKNASASSRFLTHGVDELSAMHDIEQNLRLLEPLEIHPEPVPHYSLQVPQENSEEAKSYKLEAKNYVGIHAGCATGFGFKQWPLKRFAEVAKALLQKNPNTKFLVFGGPDEEDQKDALVRAIGSRAQNISASLLTTAAIIQHCNLFISNDSGLMHIAAAVGVPIIGLFGPTDEVLTGPRGPKSTVIRAAGTKPVYTTESRLSLGSGTHTSLLATTPQIVIDKVAELGLL